MSQLARLAKPFPEAYVEKPPQGKYGSFVAHHVINQALLATVGPFDLECVQVLYGFVLERAGKLNEKTGELKGYKPAIERACVGAVVRLTCTIDGRLTRIEEAGDCEDPQNWPTDGARLKDAMSDGLKRCAMRLGLGLHLWAQEHYFLDKSLNRDAPPAEAEPVNDESLLGVQPVPSSVPSPQPGDGRVGADVSLAGEASAPTHVHRSTKENDFATIFAIARTLGYDTKEKVKELARIEGILGADERLRDMSVTRRAQLIALLDGMKAEGILHAS